ncbi:MULTISPECIES: hypothetical protein [unclassified Methylobacterium]|uniref:hypothetical protein n=1 Tax=unclassified Methylobacterium TaxID=2615210 RepID=UPI0011C206E7|nr:MULTISPECIES: hypothetical protein [unclassified Methylobacterium]QEE38732.1 hypothetical protein FVA80_06860 [Methylobacterium sp. WL1]TXN57154.1 hypothetical protein FV241_12300 [Methylobacterium sp. WL2]
MTRMLLRVAALALGLCAVPALGQPAAKAPARAGQDRTGHGKAASDRKNAGPAGGQVIGCPSLANYRMLMHDGAPAAAAVLADPKADHLGCTLMSRADITGLADRVSLGGRNYECAGVPGTTACHWMEAGAAGRPAPASPAGR